MTGAVTIELAFTELNVNAKSSRDSVDFGVKIYFVLLRDDAGVHRS